MKNTLPTPLLYIGLFNSCYITKKHIAVTETLLFKQLSSFTLSNDAAFSGKTFLSVQAGVLKCPKYLSRLFKYKSMASQKKT